MSARAESGGGRPTAYGDPVTDPTAAGDEHAAPTEHRQWRFTAPPGATTLLLIRHGESAAARDDQPFELVGGHGDPPLHPQGRAQAALLAERLGRESITAAYVTTLRRTVETAQPLLDRLGLQAEVEPDLREVFLGEWENEKYRRYMAERHPLAMRVWQEERWDLIPGAEPAEQFAGRVGAAVERIAARHPDELVAVFTHGGVIGAILALATRSRPFAFVGADNGSISELVLMADRWVLRSYNDTAHLRDLPDTPVG